MELATAIARDIRSVVQSVGGAFMTSPELAEVEAAAGLPPRTLYVRGRSAVLGDVPPVVAAEAFGIFPKWLFDLALPAASAVLDVPASVRVYVGGLARWSRNHLTDIESPRELADLLLRVTNAADASGLVLFAGWREVPPPAGDVERLGFALMLFRELRGGLHFAALRASGLSVPEAVVVDPEGGHGRLLRTAWPAEDADALIATARPDAARRWQTAETLTDIDELFAAALSCAEIDELARRLASLDRSRRS
ncbi:hypothetical protein [Amycolatopsis sp. FDAARGOS 1241]|uniref:SCO6745 family protein n=1 Tax=Amycolatopsis sp. FDAARGOS 1241 TaxID=2778070 RepID=UPI0019502894|nr:hypothetical protein [Amycolatopsis sp. FDAARGOS 1241]QRP45615.1 hypothetical protein I6J71_41990 [Amycolatopsis sp. FDAARGOS 1241]